MSRSALPADLDAITEAFAAQVEEAHGERDESILCRARLALSCEAGALAWWLADEDFAPVVPVAGSLHPVLFPTDVLSLDEAFASLVVPA